MVSDGAFLWDFLVCRCVSPHPRLYAFLVLFIWLLKSLFYLIGFFLFICFSFLWIWVGGEVGRSWGRGNCDQNRVYEKNLLSIFKKTESMDST